MHIMRTIAVFILLLLSFQSQAGFKDWVGGLFKDNGKQTESQDSTLSNGDISSGLKQALKKGIKQAVGVLGKTDGFYGSERFRIPVPDNLQKVSKGLKKIGMHKYVNNFERTMNRAAESAVSEVKPIFSRAIRNMTMADAISILKGSNTAATDYFRRKTGDELVRKMGPVTRRATASNGVTSAYKKMVSKLGFMRQFADQEKLDIDGYITHKAIDSLFVLIAEEEKAIRQNPVKRTTQLLRKVFSHVAR